MKVIHARHAGRKIVLLSACPSMNLFVVVVENDSYSCGIKSYTLTVYRSTTLASVVSQHVACFPHDGEHGMLACWSPSGRFLSVSLLDGVITVIDVELSRTIRVFIPVRHQFIDYLRHEEDFFSDGEFSIFHADFEEVIKNFTGVTSAKERRHSNSVPIVSIRIEVAPLLAMTWVVRETEFSPLDTSSRVCLPLPQDASTALLGEALVRSSGGSAMLASLLLLERSGRLLVLPGGLYALYTVSIQFLQRSQPLAPEVPRAPYFMFHRSENTKTQVEGDGTNPVLQKITNGNYCASTLEGYLVLLERDSWTLHRIPFASLERNRQVEVLGSGDVLVPKVLEYLHFSQYYFSHAFYSWEQDCIHTHSRTLLRLPECAPFIRCSLLESIVMDGAKEATAVRVSEYFGKLNVEELEESLDLLKEFRRNASSVVENWCYRYLDVSLHLLSSAISTSVDGKDKILTTVLMKVAELKRRCETFLFHMKREFQNERRLLTYVLQRCSAQTSKSGLHRNATTLMEGNPVDPTSDPNGKESERREVCNPLPLSEYPLLLQLLDSISLEPQEKQSDLEAYQRLHSSTLQDVYSLFPLNRQQTTITSILDTCSEGAIHTLVDFTAVESGNVQGISQRELETVNTVSVVNQVLSFHAWDVSSKSEKHSFSVSLETLLGEKSNPSLFQLEQVSSMEDNRHLLLFSSQPTGQLEGTLMLLLVDNEGNILSSELEEEDTESVENKEESDDDKRHQRCVIPLERATDDAPFAISMEVSVEREFCVILAGSSYIVVDLYEV